MKSILIKSGRVIDPSNDIDEKLDVFIANGVIENIDKKLDNKYDILIDASGLIISPGFIDMHIHLRDPGQTHKETIESGAKAAVKGGFTTVVCMPNTSPVNDNKDITEYIIAKSKKLNILNILPIASVTENLSGRKITDIFSLHKSGAVGFSDDGSTIVRTDIFKEALEKTKEIDSIIIEHPEAHQLTEGGIINEGEISKQLNVKGIIDIAEDIIVSRDIIIQEKIKSNLHLTHLSTKGSYRLVKEAKKRGVPITTDVTPHHILLNEKKLIGKNTNFKVKPPLRTEKDRLAMLKGIVDGTIDCIATDHAPHSDKEKSLGLEKAPFGLIGLETSFSVLYDKLVKKNIISINRLIELMASNPAKILKLKKKGQIKKGFIADITIIAPNKEFNFTKDSFISKSSNSPFLNWKGKGITTYTIVDGDIKYTHT